MDSGIPAWITVVAALLGGAIGWFSQQYWQIRTLKRQAADDAGKILNDRKALIEEQITKTKDDRQKKELQRQLDEVNTTLLGLLTVRLGRTLKDAGLPTKDMLLTEGRSQLQPQQVIKLKEELAEVKSLPPSESIEDLLAQAAAYYYAEEYEDAKETYDRILTLNPDYPVAFSNRGNTYHKLEKYDEALTDYNHSLELEPDHPDTIMNRGVTYEKLERYDEALTDYNRSLELRPDDPLTLMNRGVTYYQLRRYDEALADYNRSVELRPDDPATLNNRGVTLRYFGRYDEALTDFNRSLELKPYAPNTLYNLACFSSLQGKVDDALTYLEKAIVLDKKNIEDAKTDTDFDNIREDPRFKKLIEGE